MKLPLETLQQVQVMLNAVPFLNRLTKEERDELAYSFTHWHFKKGETIIRQGEPGTTFHLMAKGRVGVYKAKMLGKKLIAEIGPGEFFGEIALIEHVPRTATIMATEDGEMFTLTRESFEQVLLANPTIATVIRQVSDARQAANTDT